MSEIIKSSLNGIKDFTDMENAIGTPIQTPSGVTVIPVSKVSIGFATGGLDYGAKKLIGNQNFGGGGGTGLSIAPVGLLIVDKSGKVEMLNTGVAESKDILEQIANLLERSPDILEKFKSVFQKKSAAEKASEADE